MRLDVTKTSHQNVQEEQQQHDTLGISVSSEVSERLGTVATRDVGDRGKKKNHANFSHQSMLIYIAV